MENNIEMTELELKKSIEALVNEAYPQIESNTEVVAKSEETTEVAPVVEEVVKSKEVMKQEGVEDSKGDATNPVAAKTDADNKKAEEETDQACANGGSDKIRSGSPDNTIQSTEKSLGNLSDEEVELIHAWRAEQDTSEEEVIVEVEKSLKEDNEVNLVKSLKETFTNEISELKKSMDGKDEMIKSMSDKLEALANQPAYDTKSITSLETIEKSEQEEKENSKPVIDKKQITDTMLELQLSGKLNQASHHIAEFEATGNISNQQVQKLVFDAIK